MHAQSLSHAGSKAVGLNEGSDKRLDVIDPSTFGQIAQRFDARLSGARFQVEEMEFGAQFRERVAQILGDAHHGLIERQARFYADHGEIESIRKAEANSELACFQFLFQQKSWEKKAEGEQAEQQ